MAKKTLQDFKSQQQPFYLVEWWLGPSPQDFIKEARKVRDIAIGSMLISTGLLWFLKNILDKYDYDVVLLPYIRENNIPEFSKSRGLPYFPKLSLVNRCVFLADDIEFLTSVSLQDQWRNLATDVLGSLTGIPSGYVNHLQELFTYHWVALYINQQDNFADSLQKLKRLVMSRKMTRNFTFWQGSNYPKCTMCNQREAMWQPTFSDPWQAVKNLWNELAKTNSRYFKEGEKLCVVCMVKRTLSAKKISPELTQPKFDSTSDACCAVVKKCLSDSDPKIIIPNEIKKLLEQFYKNYNNVVFTEEFPADLLYLESIRSLDKNLTQQNLDTIKHELGAINRKIHIKSVPDYYVIMRFDTDMAGKWLSGEFCPNIAPEQLQQLSKDLRYLADVLYPFIIENIWNGQIIFSSGDELLAFGPMIGFLPQDTEQTVMTAFTIAQLIRDVFKNGTGVVENFLTTFNQNDLQAALKARLKNNPYYEESQVFKGFGLTGMVADDNTKSSISAGLVVAHRHTLLQDAISQCLAAEKTSKVIANGDACTYNIMVRSGAPITLTSKWDLSGDKSFIQYTVNILEHFIHSQKQYCYSPAWFYDLKSEIDSLLPTGHRYDIRKIRRPLQAEIERLLNRHSCQDEKHHSIHKPQIVNDVSIIFDEIYRMHIVSDVCKSNHHQAAMEAWISMVAFWAKTYRAIYLKE